MGSRREREICAVFWWLCLFVEAAPGRNRGIPGAGKSRTTLPPLLHLSRGGGGEEVSCDKNSQILRKIYGFYNFSLFWLWPNKIYWVYGWFKVVRDILSSKVFLKAKNKRTIARRMHRRGPKVFNIHNSGWKYQRDLLWEKKIQKFATFERQKRIARG